MPDSVNPGGKHGSLFDRAISGATVRLMLRLDKGFAGKGTSVAVRIIVADKETTGKQPPSTINRASISKLLEAIPEIPPRSKVQPDPAPQVRPRTTTPSALFGALRTAPANSFPRPARPLPI